MLGGSAVTVFGVLSGGVTEGFTYGLLMGLARAITSLVGARYWYMGLVYRYKVCIESG